MKKKVKAKKEKEAPAKREKAEKVVLSDRTVISKAGKDRDKGGPKSKLLGLIPKKGITLKDLLKAAEAEELPVKKVKKWTEGLIRYGYAKAA